MGYITILKVAFLVVQPFVRIKAFLVASKFITEIEVVQFSVVVVVVVVVVIVYEHVFKFQVLGPVGAVTRV